MRQIRIPVVLGGLAVALTATTVSAALVTQSKYRVVDGNGSGNCIFSSAPMPFQKDDSYTGVQTKFSTDDRPVEIRCYFGQKVGDHRAKGAFYNSIRDENEYYNFLTIEEVDDGPTFYERLGSYSPDGASVDWEQMRMGIGPGAAVNCNFKADDDLGTEGCMDIDKQVRALAAKKGANLPFAAEVCISFYYKWTDEYEEKWHEHSNSWRRERTRVGVDYMARPSCIVYTATGSGPAVAPEGAKREEKKKKGPPFKFPS